MRQEMEERYKAINLPGEVSPAGRLISIRISLCHVVCGPPDLTRVRREGPMRKALRVRRRCS